MILTKALFVKVFLTNEFLTKAFLTQVFTKRAFIPKAILEKSLIAILFLSILIISPNYETYSKASSVNIANDTYLIRNAQNTNYVLNVWRDGKPVSGDNVTVYSYKKSDSNQTWVLKRSGNAYIITVGSANLVLNVYRDGKAASGDNVTVYSRVNNDVNQEWIIVSAGNGKYAIKPAGNTNLALTSTGNNDQQGKNNVNVQTYNSSNTMQQWTLASLTQGTAATPTPTQAPTPTPTPTPAPTSTPAQDASTDAPSAPGTPDTAQNPDGINVQPSSAPVDTAPPAQTPPPPSAPGYPDTQGEGLPDYIAPDYYDDFINGPQNDYDEWQYGDEDGGGYVDGDGDVDADSDGDVDGDGDGDGDGIGDVDGDDLLNNDGLSDDDEGMFDEDDDSDNYHNDGNDHPLQPGSDMLVFPKLYEYDNRFIDIRYEDWFYDSVVSAFEFGLMQGVSASEFDPIGDVTLGMAITIAARLNSIYYNGVDTIQQYDSGEWYDPYVEYALLYNIIDERLVNDRTAARRDFALIMARALPADALEAINVIEDGAIPDVPNADSIIGAAVYKLYRAGILVGNESHAYNADSSITRAETAAIVSRMADPSMRIPLMLIIDQDE